MQMIRDSLLPEAMSKFLREEKLRSFDAMTIEQTCMLDGQKTIDPAIERAELLQAKLSAKLDRDAEEADRAAFAKRKAMEAAR